MNVSRLIDFDACGNTRDLGGMVTKNGSRIRSGRLIRGGTPASLSARDTDTFMRLIGLIIDFRTDEECREKPDPVIPGIEYMHLPAFQMARAGISHEGSSDRSAMAAFLKNPGAAAEYMKGLYRNMVTDEFTVGQYAKFMRILLQTREKAVFWHCTAGKDRTGLAAALIEKTLGVADEDIAADYLASNQYQEQTGGNLAALMDKIGAVPEDALKALFSVQAEYINAAFAQIDASYGSFDQFRCDALQISDEECILLKEMYLES